nr:hypothetical protein L204_04216 [Cryptococcus depauperatus CBS 7855]
MKRDQDEKAVQVLAYLRKLPADHPYIQEGISLCREHILHERVVVSGKAGLWDYLRGVFREVIPKGIRNRMTITSEIYPLSLRGLCCAYAACASGYGSLLSRKKLSAQIGDDWQGLLYCSKATPKIILAMEWRTWIFSVACLLVSSV